MLSAQIFYLRTFFISADFSSFTGRDAFLLHSPLRPR
jgi:hypothetical protein